MRNVDDEVHLLYSASQTKTLCCTRNYEAKKVKSCLNKWRQAQLLETRSGGLQSREEKKLFAKDGIWKERSTEKNQEYYIILKGHAKGGQVHSQHEEHVKGSTEAL